MSVSKRRLWCKGVGQVVMSTSFYTTECIMKFGSQLRKWYAALGPSLTLPAAENTHQSWKHCERWMIMNFDDEFENISYDRFYLSFIYIMLIKKKVGIYINCHLLDVYIWISDAIMWPEVSKSEHHAPRGPPKHHLHDGAAEGRQVPRLLLHGQSPPLHQPRGHSLSNQDLQVLSTKRLREGDSGRDRGEDIRDISTCHQ